MKNAGRVVFGHEASLMIHYNEKVEVRVCRTLKSQDVVMGGVGRLSVLLVGCGIIPQERLLETKFFG